MRGGGYSRYTTCSSFHLMASSYNRDGGCVVYHSLFRFSIAMVIMVIVGALLSMHATRIYPLPSGVGGGGVTS